MNLEELNLFIKNYVENDKTKTAIMLTAPWGMGKSYYLNNHLIPYLRSISEFTCVLVSAYGLSKIEDLNKSLYLEARIKKLNKRNEKIQVGLIASKTIVKGIASFFNVDLSLKDEDLNKLYKSINFKNALIIIEDLERSKIDILDLLGYINNLTELDGAKVLLVANEKEIIKKCNCQTKLNKEKDSIDEDKDYKKVKEKTIRDTVVFRPDIEKTLMSILSSFGNRKIKELIKSNNLCNKIFHKILSDNDAYKLLNFRSIIFGIQKTIDIFAKVNFSYSDNFFIRVLEDNIIFSIKYRANYGEKMNEYNYHIFKFSYDYIVDNALNLKAVEDQYDDFVKLENVQKKNDALKKSLNIIYTYLAHSDDDVICAIENILEILDNKDIIPKKEYSKLGNFLISVKSVIGDEKQLIRKCLEKMIDNVGYESFDFVDSVKFCSGIVLENKSDVDEYVSFQNKLIDKAKKTNQFNSFDYSIANLSNFLDYVYKNRDSFVCDKCFFYKIDINQFSKLIEQCTSKEIMDIRHAILSVYSFSNLNDFFADDLYSLNILRKKIKLFSLSNQFDNIKKKQFFYFNKNLEDIILRIDKNFDLN